MSQRYCQGCGAQLQSAEEAAFGFVPRHLLDQGPVLCQRCFRITHYGRDDLGSITAQDALESIKAGLAWSTGVIFVVDLLDFESGLPSELVRLVNGRKIIVVVNKLDLIPKTTRVGELEQWVQSRLAGYGLARAPMCLVSAMTGDGFPQFANLVTRLGKKILTVGTTNVGKSSVLQRLLQMRIGGGKRERIKPTISPYPGTTVSVSRWKCPGDLVLADSPGYVPYGRISDVVSPKLAAQIIPHKSLSSHLYQVKPGDLVFIKGLCVVECIRSQGEGLIIGFTGSGVQWQKSTNKHREKWLRQDAQGSQNIAWDQHMVCLEPGQDLFISGLGWISARKAKYELQVHIPKKVSYVIRPNLLGPKK